MKDQYVAQRVQGAYIATVCQPEAAFDLSFAAQFIGTKEEHAKALNKRLQIESATRGLRFVPLDISAFELVIFTDGSFANNDDFSSQIGFVIVVADGNLIHWSAIE